MKYILLAVALLFAGCAHKFVESTLNKIKWTKSIEEEFVEEVDDMIHFGPGPQYEEVGPK